MSKSRETSASHEPVQPGSGNPFGEPTGQQPRLQGACVESPTIDAPRRRLRVIKTPPEQKPLGLTADFLAQNLFGDPKNPVTDVATLDVEQAVADVNSLEAEERTRLVCSTLRMLSHGNSIQQQGALRLLQSGRIDTEGMDGQEVLREVRLTGADPQTRKNGTYFIDGIRAVADIIPTTPRAVADIKKSLQLSQGEETAEADALAEYLAEREVEKQARAKEVEMPRIAVLPDFLNQEGRLREFYARPNTVDDRGNVVPVKESAIQERVIDDAKGAIRELNGRSTETGTRLISEVIGNPEAHVDQRDAAVELVGIVAEEAPDVDIPQVRATLSDTLDAQPDNSDPLGPVLSLLEAEEKLREHFPDDPSSERHFREVLGRLPDRLAQSSGVEWAAVADKYDVYDRMHLPPEQFEPQQVVSTAEPHEGVPASEPVHPLDTPGGERKSRGMIPFEKAVELMSRGESKYRHPKALADAYKRSAIDVRRALRSLRQPQQESDNS